MLYSNTIEYKSFFFGGISPLAFQKPMVYTFKSSMETSHHWPHLTWFLPIFMLGFLAAAPNSRQGSTELSSREESGKGKISSLDRLRIKDYLRKGDTCFENGDYNCAISSYTKELAISPSDCETLVKRGKAYFILEKSKLAIADFTRALEIDPNTREILIHLGDANLQEAGAEEAMPFYTRALELQPDDPAVHTSRGEAYRIHGQEELALQDFNHAIQIKPDYPIAYSSRAWLHSLAGDYESAAADYNQILQIKPDYIKYLEEQIHKKPLKESYKLFFQTPDWFLSNYLSILSSRASEYASNANDDLAIQDYSRILELRPDDAEAHIHRGDVYRNKGDYNSAINDYNAVLKLKPENPIAYTRLGHAYLGKDAYDLALRQYSRALEINPQDISAMVNRGHTYYLLGQFDSAIQDYNRALIPEPGLSVIYLMRGYAYCFKGNPEHAWKDFYRALQADPNDMDTYNSIAWFLATCPETSCRNGPKALALALKACKAKEWKQAALIDTLAAAYAENGEFPNAIKYEKQAIKLEAAENIKEQYQLRLELFNQHKSFQEKDWRRY